MDLKLTWSTLIFILVGQVSCGPYLSNQDIALLANEKDPKCFTTNLKNFICFWEAPEGKSTEFFYKIDDEESECNVKEQKTEEGRILHVCIFPPNDVYLYVTIYLRVVVTHTNSTIYSRTTQTEKNLLLDPPSNIALHHTGKTGQLLVKWQKNEKIKPMDSYDYEIIRSYSSESLADTILLASSPKSEHRFVSLVPGQMCSVKMRLRPSVSSATKGHWSNWSPSVTAMVPQSAEDVEFQCHTPDLHQIQCRWNEGIYGYGNYTLHYKPNHRSAWEICDNSTASGIQCVLYEGESTVLEIYLRAELRSFNRIFYSDVIRMNSSIKTEAPDGLKEESNGDKHCLSWNSPLPLISQHLIYQIRYNLQGESEWKLFIVPSPKTSTCLDVQVGHQYCIQVKAMPNGSLYSGQWSAWSKCLVVQLPSNTGLLYIVCVPFGLLIISVILLSILSRHGSKVKQFLWPPVPNLNGVLESFLKDINSQHWVPNFSTKLCDEDIHASVVEFMPEEAAPVGGKPANCPHFPQHVLMSGDSNRENAMEGLEMNREYVTLNTGEVLPCLTGNDYIYKMNSSSGQIGNKLCCCCSSACYIAISTPSTNILNHSYAQAGYGEASNPVPNYTNLEDASAAKEE